jgi:serine/threonine protein kinase
MPLSIGDNLGPYEILAPIGAGGMGEIYRGRGSKGPMPLNEALGIMRQVAYALQAAYEKGITHRDPKTANIKIKPHGPVKMPDLGLADVGRAAGSTGENSPTLTSAMGSFCTLFHHRRIS